MDIQSLPKVSADAHVDEPHSLWYERLSRHLRDQAPRRIQENEEGGWSLVVNGERLGWTGTTAGGDRSLDRAREDAVDVDIRLEMLHQDGLHGEMIYPTIGLYIYNMVHQEAAEASCRIYNDWIHERLGGRSERVRYAALLPAWGVAAAREEIARLANRPSLGGWMLPLVGTPEWNLPVWEDLWSAIAETGLPVVMHQGTGHDMIFYRGWGSATANLLATQSMAPRATALFACGGVLERHPDLHVVLVEVNAGWVAWTMSTLDEYYQAHVGWAKPKLRELPSHYIRRQIHATFQQDPVAITNIPHTGTDCLMWGNDYPHPESTFPNSAKVLTSLLQGVHIEDASRITGLNAARLFGFDLAIIDQPA